MIKNSYTIENNRAGSALPKRSLWQQPVNWSSVATAIALTLSTQANAVQLNVPPEVVRAAASSKLDFDLVVTSAANNGNSTALRFDGATGESLGEFALGDEITDPRDIVLAPLAETVQIKNGDDRILTYNARTGNLVREFAFQSGLNPGGGVFGPNDNYFVGARTSGAIAQFDGETGAFIGNFVTPGQVDFPRGFDFSKNGRW